MREMEDKKTTNPGRPYDLEERTFLFAKETRELVKMLPKTPGNVEDGKQLVRSSGSVGANYIEANESVSRKDFLLRIKTCRKEAKESAYWLRLLDSGGKAELEGVRTQLRSEAFELMNIFAAILRKST
jgi:four helix bundle protein